MEATHFRLKNLVQDKKGILCQIVSLQNEFEDEKQITAWPPAGGHCLVTLPHRPIPLTEEWLIKFGLEKDTETDYRWFLEDWLAYDVDDNCIRIADSWEFGKLKYVHQLQNLYFALTGKELI